MRASGLPASLDRLRERADLQLAHRLPSADRPPQRLHQAMRYAVLGGGKRMRPLLVYAAGLSLGAQIEQLDAAAVAVEVIHAYSLVHDDLPAMDNDDLRRGQPTCHKAFDEATAILAGDALQALAFEIVAMEPLSGDASTRLSMLGQLAAACGASGMAGGQAFDLAAVGQDLSVAELERMHVHKTGALIRASVLLGAHVAQCSDSITLSHLERYGHCVGLAFQIRDDILDVEGESAVIGKTAGKDQADNKPTYPAVLGMDASRLLAAQLLGEALDSLQELPADTELLAELAEYCISRET